MGIRYRPEIDGLRTIAVLSVIIYHAEFAFNGSQLLGGGFLGVDIFFVISGFLITSLILKEYEADGRFSISNFYERRARRLLPALLAVMLVSLSHAWELLLPQPLIDFSWSLVASLGFVSNFYWNTTLQQYGTDAAALKPFLHTWSLAVEEQFYILYPLLLVALLRWRRDKVTVVLGGILLISLLYAEWQTARDSSFSFYMLMSRLWELLTGAMLAISTLPQRTMQKRPRLGRYLPSLGIVLILYSVQFIEFSANHPGLVTSIAVLGTALIIAFANEGELTYRLLSSRPFISIGLISYSLYLWHYPIFAFARTTNSTPSLYDKAEWIGLTLILSVISYILVERPFRNRKTIPLKPFIAGTLLLTAVTVGTALYWIENNGFVSRLQPILETTQTLPTALKEYLNSDKEHSQLFLLGDSHMGILAHPISMILPEQMEVVSMTHAGCLYLQGFNMVLQNKGGMTDENCSLETQQQRRKVLLAADRAIIMVGGRLPLYLTDHGYDNGEGGIEKQGQDGNRHAKTFVHASIKTSSSTERNQLIGEAFQKGLMELAERGHQVVLIYPVPEVGWDVPRRINELLHNKTAEEVEQLLATHVITTSYANFMARTRESFAILDGISHPNVYRVYPHKLLCNTELEGRCLTHDSTKLYYRDDDHLSDDGVAMLLDEVARVLHQPQQRQENLSHLNSEE